MITAALPIHEASQVADARRRAVERARSLSLSDTAAGQLSIVVTELATNILKFGREGSILLGSYEDAGGEGIQVLALDKGPGMDVVRCLADGYSTAGSAGHGLGAVRRLAKVFAIESWSNGTAVLARVGPGDVRRTPVPVWGMFEIPLAGEASCGDAICARRHADGWTVIVADGLGHGLKAAEASMQAMRVFRGIEHLPASDIVARVHDGLRHSRGAAVAVARLDEATAMLSFCGIGNVAASIVTAHGRQQLVSLPGTAGHNARKLSTFDHRFNPGALLVMHSDGLSSSWSFDPMPGLLAAHPALIAGVLFRDHGRARDDASVIVVRGASP